MNLRFYGIIVAKNAKSISFSQPSKCYLQTQRSKAWDYCRDPMCSSVFCCKKILCVTAFHKNTSYCTFYYQGSSILLSPWDHIHSNGHIIFHKQSIGHQLIPIINITPDGLDSQGMKFPNWFIGLPTCTVKCIDCQDLSMSFYWTSLCPPVKKMSRLHKVKRSCCRSDSISCH